MVGPSAVSFRVQLHLAGTDEHEQLFWQEWLLPVWYPRSLTRKSWGAILAYERVKHIRGGEVESWVWIEGFTRTYFFTVDAFVVETVWPSWYILAQCFVSESL